MINRKLRRKVFSRRQRVSFIVDFPQPKGASVNDCLHYVQDAVSSWRGQTRPPGSYGDDDEGDPMFGLNHEKVRVRRYMPKRNQDGGNLCQE